MSNGKQARTLAEVARLAKTTKSTVSRVLADDPRISARTKKKVMAIVRKHEYRPNALARALASGRTGLIGVLASNISSGFFADVIRGIDLVAIREKGHLLCSFAHGNDDYVRLWDELARGGQVEGLVLIDPPLELLATPLRDPGIPLVICAARPGAGARGWSKLDCATVNNRKAIADIVAHLYSQGCRHVIHLAGPINTFDSQERRKGFLSACRRYADLKAGVIDGHLIQDDGARTIERMLRGGATLPHAFVAFNDSTALGVMEAIRRLAPDKTGTFALTGWDDSPAAAVLGLTSVRMPITDLGEAGATRIFGRLTGALDKKRGRNMQLDCTLVVRASSELHSMRPWDTRS